MATGGPNAGVSGWENYFMDRIDRYIRSLLLAAAITAPALVVVEAKAQEVQVRIYDRDHHDYHNWDAHEDRAYRHYLVVHHRTYVEYSRQGHSVQRNYWNYRHTYPDRD
jgi:hypothetical protein